MACLYSQYIDTSDRVLIAAGMRTPADSNYYGYHGNTILNDYTPPHAEEDIKPVGFLDGFIDGFASATGASTGGGASSGSRQQATPYGDSSMASSPGSHSSSSSGGGANTSGASGKVRAGNKGSKEDKICGVCGDKALGFNFDAISCESCKAFFRRNAPKGPSYFVCPYDEKCKMDMSNRRFCKRCRLKKCFEIGMKREYILSEEEKLHKRQKILENKYLKKGISPPGPSATPAPQSAVDSAPGATDPYCVNSPSNVSQAESSPEASKHQFQQFQLQQQRLQQQQQQQHMLLPYTPQSHQLQPLVAQHQQPQQNVYHRQQQQQQFVAMQQYHQQSPYPPQQQQPLPPRLQQMHYPAPDVPAILYAEELNPWDVLTDEDTTCIFDLHLAYRNSLEVSMDKEVSRNEADFTDLVNIAELSVRRVIAMAKQVPAFKDLSQVEQIHLLKGGSIELLILRSVITFDKEKQHFLDPVDHEESKAMNLEQLERAENGTGLFEDHMKFVRSLALDLRADETTLILLLVISLFSPDRDNLECKDKVAREQDKYAEILRKYLLSVHPSHEARGMYPQLLMKLTDIRNLNEEHSQVLLKVNPEGIHPLMKEVLDLRCSEDTQH